MLTLYTLMRYPPITCHVCRDLPTQVRPLDRPMPAAEVRKFESAAAALRARAPRGAGKQYFQKTTKRNLNSSAKNKA